MKDEYQKPIIEIITFNIDVLTASAGGGSGEAEVDVGEEWYKNR